ncbi:MAG TPA: phage major capsid protein [Thermomicrobiales bacterium]|nr:phage major capsid protein [Thermomicrobiales bacterium]
MAYNNVISRADVQAMIREQVSEIMLDQLNNESAALTLFTRVNVPTNQTRFPVLSALPTAYFVSGDTGLKQTTEAAWANKYLDVEEIAAIVPIPDAVRDDAGFDIGGQVVPLLRDAIARTLDSAIFFGTSKPASWPTDIAASAVAAGNVVARGTATQAKGGIAEDFNQLIGTLEDDGFAPTGFVANMTLRRQLRSARDAQGQLLMDVNGGVNNIWGLPTVYPMAGLWPAGVNAAEVFALQTRNFVIGVRQDFTVTFHTEGVITDNTGAIIYNLMQQDMSAIRIVFRAGWQVVNPINYTQATEASRYPAAVLRSPAT